MSHDVSITRCRIAAPARAGKAKGRNLPPIGRQGSQPRPDLGPAQRIVVDDPPRPFVISRPWAPVRRSLGDRRPRAACDGRDQARQGHGENGKEDEPAKPALVATFGDWNVFVGEAGKGRICYTLAQPKSREPASLKRDPGYAFISDRPAEGVRNEVSFIMGFDVAAGDAADAKPELKPGEKPAPKPDAKSKTPDAPSPGRSPWSMRRRSRCCRRGETSG